MKPPIRDNKKIYFSILMVVGVLLIGLGLILGITQGAAQFTLREILSVFLNYDGTDPKQVLLIGVRMPRTIIAGLVGASLAVAGAIMQGVTRNPMADSGLMGLSSGAIFMVALSYTVFSGVNYTTTMLLAFVGASMGAMVIYGISYFTPGTNQPMKLVLAGAAMTALFSSLSQGLTILSSVTQNVAFWTMGSVASANWQQVVISSPVIISVLILATLLGHSITLISMGDDVARAVGVNVGLIRGIAIIIVVILAGVSVALAGLIAFVGIVIPHTLRWFIGQNYTYLIPLSAVYGGVLLILADVFARIVVQPSEVPIGALIAVLGVPVFLMISGGKANGSKR